MYNLNSLIATDECYGEVSESEFLEQHKKLLAFIEATDWESMKIGNKLDMSAVAYIMRKFNETL